MFWKNEKDLERRENDVNLPHPFKILFLIDSLLDDYLVFVSPPGWPRFKRFKLAFKGQLPVRQC